MNAPERYERFVVPEGTKNFVSDLLGNFNATEMLGVSGCQLPHPLKYKIIVRIQAYNQATNDLDKELDFLKNQFEVLCFTLRRWPSFRLTSTKELKVLHPDFNVSISKYQEQDL